MQFTKEQLIAKLQHRLTVAAKYPEVEEAELDAAIFKIALASLDTDSAANEASAHPASGPLSNYRLHRIREILRKAAAQSDGGNLGYAMADAVKAFDELLEVRKAEPVGYYRKGSDGFYFASPTEQRPGTIPLYRHAQPAPVDNTFIPKNLDRALGVLGMALPESKEEFYLQTERWIQRLIDRVIRYSDEFKAQPAPLEPIWAATKYPVSRPVPGAQLIVWDETGNFIGYGSSVDTRDSGVAIQMNDGRRLDSNHDLRWQYALQPAPVVPDERKAFEAFIDKRFGDTIDQRRAKNGDQGYMAWDMVVAWIVWQGRAAMLNGGKS